MVARDFPCTSAVLCMWCAVHVCLCGCEWVQATQLVGPPMSYVSVVHNPETLQTIGPPRGLWRRTGYSPALFTGVCAAVRCMFDVCLFNLRLVLSNGIVAQVLQRVHRECEFSWFCRIAFNAT